jgi:hypothetical protein
MVNQLWQFQKEENLPLALKKVVDQKVEVFSKKLLISP